jgi:hypothetical protein
VVTKPVVYSDPKSAFSPNICVVVGYVLKVMNLDD